MPIDPSKIDWNKVKVLNTESLKPPKPAPETGGDLIKAGPGSNAGPGSDDWLRYSNQNAVRNLPLSDKLTDALSFLPELGIEMEVFSGGQPRKGSGGKRVGSTRHDDGNAADVFFYKDGRKLDWANQEDLPYFEEIVKRARANGITGIGAGDGYMQPGSMHIGFGNEVAWGAGGKSANAPEWLNTAFHSHHGHHDHDHGKTARAQASIIPESYYDSVRHAESTGNPNAKNKRSSATGLFQFTDATWANLMTSYPQLGLTKDGRLDPEQQERAMRVFTEDNAKRLTQNGIEIDGGSLYAAHFLGAGGAVKAYRASDDTPMSDLVSSKVLKANPFLKKMDVSGFKSWAGSKGNGPGRTAIASASGGSDLDLSGVDGTYLASFDGNPSNLTSAEWGNVPVIEADGSISHPESNITSSLQDGSIVDQEAEDLQRLHSELEKTSPGRYAIIPQDQYDAWKADWDANNQSTGFLGDTGRLLQSGFAGIGLAGREVVRMIPGIGEDVVSGIDAIDTWMHGRSSDVFLGEQIEKATATLTPETRGAREKQWWDSEKSRPGSAWMDPRSYYAGLVESVPGTVLTMSPSMILARGTFTKAVAAGATTKAASAAAARTALIAGAVGEGLLGGGQTAVSVREHIAALPRQALEESQVVQQLMKDGDLSLDEAIDAVTNDAATQAFVIAGVATGTFGGFGDRVLAKILSEGVGGNLAQRVAQGASREAVAEGVFEEAPQEAGSQLAENLALKNTVEPDRDLTEGVANAAAGGMAVGGAMGAGMGAAGGAMSPRDSVEPEGAPEPVTSERTERKGTLAESVDHAKRQTAETSGGSFFVSDPAIAGMPAGELNGVEVQVAPDQDGVREGMKRVVLPNGQTHILGERLLVPKQLTEPTEGGTPAPFADGAEATPNGAPEPGTDVRVNIPGADPVMGKVEGYADGEAIVMDVGTGEVLQVPLEAISTSPAATDTADLPVGEDLPEDLPGSEPIAGETRVTDLPPESETGTLSDVPYRTPEPGQRVIVEAEGIERFSGTVQTYEEGGDEVLVRKEDGTELQVPRDALRVSNLTEDQIEERDLKENPPVEREKITGADGNAREVRGSQVVLPDEKHARLFDLGKLRRDSKQISGRGTLDMDSVSPGEQARLAEEFEVSPQRLGQLADDYRFRVENAAKKSKTRTPVKLWPVNATLLDRMRDEDRREASAEADFPTPEPIEGSESTLAADWDGLPVQARKSVLQAANVKRAPATRWADFPENIRKKLEATQQVSTQDTAVPKYAVQPKTIMPQDFRDMIAEAKGDMRIAADKVRSEVQHALSAGLQVHFWVDGKKIPIVAIENGLMQDPSGQRWGAMPLATGTDANGKDKIEFSAKVPKPAPSLDTAAQEAATSPENDLPEPSRAQKEAGNYKKGHVSLGGFDIAIENPKGSQRKGVDPNGKPWAITMKSHYGYFKGTIGRDKDHIDTFIRPGTETLADTDPAFVIDQVDPASKKFDEHKVMLGFKNKAQATRAYKANYDKGWKGLGTNTETTVGELKAWFADGDTKQPFAKSANAKKASTAPEHIHNTGKPLDESNVYNFTAADQPTTSQDGTLDEKVAADGLDLPEISLEQFREVTDEWASLFKAPAKSRSLTTELRNEPYLKPAEAKAKVQSWKDHTKRQFDSHRGENFGKTILSLFDYTGQWSQPWEDAGYNVLRFDIQNDQDVMDFSVEYFTENYDISDVYGILAACPCTDFSGSGSGHWKHKDLDGRTEASKELVFKTLATIEYFRPWGFWAIENPVGRIARLTGLPKWRLGFDPNHFGENYTKKTLIWGDFDAYSMPVANAEPVEGSKMWKKYGGKSMKTKNARSETPEGFAYSFFMGNNYVDAAPSYILPRRFPDASGAIKAALKSGMDPKRVEDLMRETYEHDDAEIARTRLLSEIKKRRAKGKPEAKAKPAKTGSQFAGNKLFTEDKVTAARKRLRAKLTQVNSGIDPEVLIDGMTIAGAYIESGVRKFSDYASAMVKDLGPNVRPYLLSFYEGARNYPGLETEGMDSVEDARKAFDAIMDKPAAVTKPMKKVIGEVSDVPKKTATRKKVRGEKTLTQDWGVEHIDGWLETPEYPGTPTDFGVKGGLKDAFLKETQNYLKAVEKELAKVGFTKYTDHKGNTDKRSVTVNPAGPAVSGDVSLVMSGPNGHPGVYVTIGETALRGSMTPQTKQGVAIMWRTNGPNNRTGTRSGNYWAKTTLTAEQLATILVDGVGLNSVAAIPTTETTNDTTSPSPSDVRTGDEGQGPDSPSGDGDGRDTLDLFGQPDEPVERKPEPGKATGDRRGSQRSKPALPGKPADSTAGAEQRVPERGGDRDGTGSGTDRKPQRESRDYRIGTGELTRQGSWRATAERNVQIVELVNKLEKEGRTATKAERALMVQYTGWGASEIANGIFPNSYGRYKDEKWEALGKRLKEALSDADYKTAARSTQYAHYTSEAVIRSIYDGLNRIGFAGGSVLEPGMGTGHFRGLMPSSIAGASTYTGIEFDGMTAAIAAHLYPDSRIMHKDYTATKLPKDFFDAAIGNPPFAQAKITNDPEYRKYGFSLHDYFFAKTIDRVKPGGVMVFVTSRYTMDKVRDSGRRYLAERANLLGAIRLPQTAFQANAGTEVVTDVLFLQKRGPGVEDNGVSWTGTKEIKVGENTFTVNEYIADHPEMVLGKHDATGSMYRANEYTVAPYKSKNIEKIFAEAVQKLPEGVYQPDRGSKAEQAKVIEKDFDPKALKEGGLYLSESGDLMIRQDGVGQAFTERQTSTGKLKPLNKREETFLKDFVTLRDAVKQTQYDQLTDGDWESSLQDARRAYRRMTARNGQILAYSTIERTDKDGNTQSYKRFKNEPLFMIDPDGPLAFTLEKITESGEIVEGPIFNGRVLNKPSDPEIVTTQDAMFVSLDKLGRFDLTDVAKRAGRTEAQTIQDLGTSIYEDPGEGWQLADAYLSGNVVQKLAEARAASELDPKYTRNVEALLTVQPRPLGTTEIDVKLGAPWIPASDIESFAREILGKQIRVGHNIKVGTWQVEGDRSTIGEFAMDNHPTSDILNKILNNSQLRVTRSTVNAKGNKTTETDPESTEKLNDIARKIKDRFRAWIWSDADRSKRLVNFYNDNYNNIAPRKFDGSHLTLPGTSLRFNLHPHQKRTIWRAIQTGDTYIAHAVGAGKTFEMIAIGMEERRLGLSKKPLYVVPNHMLGQFSREFLELYPAANIMVADEKNFHTSNRRRFIAQAALNDPDAIIITHSAFGRIGLKDETNDKMVQGLIDEWKELQEEIEQAEGKGLSFKRAQAQVERLEKRLIGKQKREGKDAVMTFEELGVDRLIIDEMHEFRKLDFVTNQGTIKGIDPQGSQRAMDLYSKVTYLRETNKDPKRTLIGASGTPVTNTMGELFTVQRFFQPDILEDIGAHNFDSWASQFGDIVEGLEQNAAGNFETVSRFAKFQNVPELMRRVRSFMDILTSSSLGELVTRPTRVNPPREIKTTPTPTGYKAYQANLDARIKAIRERKGPPQKGDDIILKVIADGRFSAIDMRFVTPGMSPDPDSKLNKMLDDVIADYKATAGNEYTGVSGEKDPIKGSTLVVFGDIGLGDAVVKSRGFDMKAWIEKRLTDAGIPKDHFAFIRDHKAHAKKERLFADLREGKKRILIGGKDMETGVNVQKRLTHLYHLDAPWFPASVEQREGRADRQGNQNADITIRAYATKGSYDSTMWSMNARKARFIEQALNGDDSVRKMEDVSEASAFEMAAALSSGDPRYLQLAGLRQEVERLGRLRKAHFDEQNRYKRNEHFEEKTISAMEADRTAFEEAGKKGHRIEAGKFSATVGKKTFDKRDDWSKALYKAFLLEADKQEDATIKLGVIGGHDVSYFGAKFDDGSHKASLALDLPGQMPDLAEHPTAEDVNVGGIAQKAANQVNKVYSMTGELSEKIEQAERRLKQIRAQIGAPFPEEALYLEKQAELSELELELQGEKQSGATEAEKSGSAKDVAKARSEAQAEPDSESSRGLDSKAFQRWFGDSKVVDESGKPLVVYHGTGESFESFDPQNPMTVGGMELEGAGVKASFFTSSREVAQQFADASAASETDDAIVLPVYLAIERPYVIHANGQPWTNFSDEVIGALKDGQHDGVVMYRVEDGFAEGAISDVYVVPDARQIKSVDNSGSFDPEDSRILYSKANRDDGATVLNAEELRAELNEGALSDLVSRLLESGTLTLADSAPNNVPADTQGFTDSKGNITLIAGRIPKGNANAVLLHEAFHTGKNALFSRPVWQKLEDRLNKLYRQFEKSGGTARRFYDAARDNVAHSGDTGSLAVEEFGAYAIEAYETAPRTVARWAQDAIGAVKAWMLQRFGRQIGAVTPAQLRSLAVAALRDGAKGERQSGNANEKGSLRLSRRIDKRVVTEQLSGRWTDLSPKLLSLVPLNYFTELKRPGMRAVDRYLRVKREMDSYRGLKHEEMDGIAQTWRKFASRNRKTADGLASLMHDATRLGIDPAVDYGNLKPPVGYDSLHARFAALPPAARGLYKTVRNAYVRMQAEVDRLILDNVKKAQAINEKEAKKRYERAKAKIERDPALTEPDRREKMEALSAKFKADMTRSRFAAKARMTRLRQTFEKNRVPAPYFPLARFGDYFVTVRDMAGDVVSFTRFESDADRRRWVRENKAKIEDEFPGVFFEQGVLSNSADIRNAMDPRMVAEIDGILKDANVDQEVMDAIYQKWLQSMPDLSVRKRYIHRKGVKGFHQDALRAFASHMFHSGHQMGKLKFGLDLQEALDDARDQVRNTDDPTRAGQLVNELAHRHEWVMNPKGSKLAQKVNSAAFVWYLAATPAAAVINMTQPILVGVPVLGAKLGGVTKASDALLKASADLARGKGDISQGKLTGDEKRAIRAMYASGAIDRTMAMEIAGIGDSGVEYAPLRHAVMSKISWLFHKAEVVNREVVALAAYRMARAKGQGHEQAVDTAHELNFTVNYDYANSSRPRILQSDFAKIVGVFMSYQLNVWYRIFRDIHQSFAGDNAQARKEARYQLGGLMAMQTLLGGTSGFFMYNVLMGIAGMFFDDEDNPFSFKHEVETAIYDLFGKSVGGMIINGVPGHLTGIDLTSRVGMADFFLRMPDGSNEGKDWWLEFVAGSLGASVGAVGNMVVGAHYMREGDTARGAELMVPKAIKDLMKAWRYANEGLLTRKGDVILPKDDMQVWDIVKQASGFTPAKVSTAHELRGRKYDAQNRIKNERSTLINRFATAIRNGDQDARKRVIQQIIAWNKRSYAKALPITRETLERSLKTRARLAARREDGFLPINEKIGAYLSKRTPENPYR